MQALCTRPSFLPALGDLSHLTSPEAALLDRQFRMLREDMMGALNKTVKDMGLVGNIQVWTGN